MHVCSGFCDVLPPITPGGFELGNTPFTLGFIFCSGSIFFLQRPAPIQNGTPNQNLGTPTFGSQNRPIKVPPTYFRLDVPNLEILPRGDIPSISTNSIMPFNNVDPKLLHCFIQLHQIGLRSASRSNISGFASLSLGSIWRLPFLYARLKLRVLSAYVLSLR